MKFSAKIVIATVVLSSSFAMGQQAERDFGDLVPEPHFVITQKKSSLKDSADISSYEIKVSPQKEEFVYKVNSVRTPRKFLKRNGDFKLTVERQEGKISRISSVDYTSSEDGTGAQGVQTSAIGVDGKVDSLSNCYQEYKFGWFNLKKDKSAFECVTINRDVCSYFEKNAIDEALVEKINSCSDLLGKFTEHQEKLEELTKGDHSANMKALGKLDGRISGIRNFYEVEPKTLKDIAHVVQGYGRAVAQCQFLKEKDYLRPEAAVGDDKKDDPKTTEQ